MVIVPVSKGVDEEWLPEDVTVGEVAKIYGVQPAAISKIVTGRTWKHLRLC